jgi:hypothetical protein
VSSLSLFLLLALLPSLAFGERKCKWNDEGTFYGGSDCDGGGTRNSIGHSVVSAGEVVQLNPAALPTLPTPIGAELNINSRAEGPNQSRTSLSLLKGFDRLGFGLGTWTTDTMSGPELSSLFAGPNAQNYQAYQALPENGPGLRAGLALALIRYKRLALRVGGGIGQNSKNGPGASSAGIAVDLLHLNFGASFAHESFPNLPKIRSEYFSAGLLFGPLFIGNNLGVHDADTAHSVTNTISARWSDDTTNFFFSYKSYTSSSADSGSWISSSAHFNVNQHLSVGYIYGLYLKSHSLSIQAYL